ncbi:hypothetical protein NFHSH190041_23650 [Shewanella sp. NFH-SH190041]|uniref:hypothetical protein n=1 Tax=Shewanella sp. NFH-SH190041 TaxID=2950245 RepID=UPI0021C4BEA1|nr:hypothetical protein [Shewanella sp. NFH-SH190041]BDM64913.1 hypothetical protein NFHSH190041_23650 [Shewanella sp. NFH-SH190041]
MINPKLCLALLILATGSAKAVVYDEIKYAYSRECPDEMVPILPSDIADNMDFFRYNLSKWQISQIGNNHVIMGYGYNFTVKPGRAFGIFCVPKSQAPVTYDKITFNRECPPLSFPVPPEDVPANLNFFKNNMGRWQITEIGNKHVITGSGYGFQVKKGTAGHFFCAHDTVIRDQKTMDAIARDPALFEELLSKYNPLTMITSNGNSIAELTMPPKSSAGQEFVVERQADAAIKIKFGKRTVSFPYGFDTVIPKGKTVTFKFDGYQWLMKPAKMVSSQTELSRIGKDSGVLNQLLTEHRAVEIKTQDGEWTPVIELSRDAPDGTMVSFVRNSTYSVKFNYSSTTIVPPKGTKTVFIKRGGSWFVISDKSVRDNATLRKLGGEPALLKRFINDYSTLKLQTSDGNWTRNFTIPKATDIGNIRNIILIRYSSWWVGLKFPGVTLRPRKGSTMQFIAFDDWSLQAQRSLDSNADVQLAAQSSSIKSLLDRYGNLNISLTDGAYLSEINLPDNATNGEMINITRRTVKPVKVRYSGKQHQLSLGLDTLFYFDNNKWQIVSLN